MNSILFVVKVESVKRNLCCKVREWGDIMLCLAVAQVAGYVFHVGKKNSRVTGLRMWKVKADVRKRWLQEARTIGRQGEEICKDR